ncbi:MAG: hypothetical protein AB8F34_08120 [Akkermansiaceae bacterium]
MDPVQSWLDAKEVRRMAESLMAPPPEVDPTKVDAGYGESFEGFADSFSGEEVNSTGIPNPPERRTAVETSLAKAQEVAQGSGMLRHPAEQSSSPPMANQPAEATNSLPQDSPFQVSTHQDLTEQVPMAQQLSPPPEHFKPTVAKPPEPEPAPHIEQSHQAPVAGSPSFGRGVAAEVESSGARGPFLDRLHQFSEIVRRGYGAQAMFLIDNDGQVILDEVENPKLIQVARTLANASYTAHRQSAGSAAVGNLHVKIGANATLEVVPVHSRYGLLVLGVIFPAPLGAERVIQLTGLLEKAVDPNK